MPFVSLLLKLRSPGASRLTPADGVYAHAAILKAITAVNPDAGHALHRQQRCKPLSLALTVTGQRLANLRIALLADRALDYTNSLLEALSATSNLRLGTYIYTVEGLDPQWNRVANWTDFTSSSAKRIKIRFITPTAITRDTRQGGRYILLYPEPAAVFGGLAYRWRDLGGPDLPVDDLAEGLTDGGCVISRHQLQTVEFKTRNRTQIGFTGYAVYDCRAAGAAQRRTLAALAKLAQFSGIGYQTTRGMGAVQVEAS